MRWKVSSLGGERLLKNLPMATETPAEPRLDTAGGTNYRRAGQSGAEGRAVSARDGHPRNPPLIPGCAPPLPSSILSPS
jgi:hypothetical protein